MKNKVRYIDFVYEHRDVRNTFLVVDTESCVETIRGVDLVCGRATVFEYLYKATVFKYLYNSEYQGTQINVIFNSGVNREIERCKLNSSCGLISVFSMPKDCNESILDSFSYFKYGQQTIVKPFVGLL